MELLLRNAADMKYPNNQGLYSSNINTNNYYRLWITLNKPCGKQSFSKYYYEFKTEGGVELHRTWLCYSPKLNMCLCEPWLLFANRNKLSSYFLVDGDNNWKGLSKRINQHESSVLHEWHHGDIVNSIILHITPDIN